MTLPIRRCLIWVTLPLLLMSLSGCLIAPNPSNTLPDPSPTATSPPLPPIGGRIAFLSDRTEHRRELWAIAPDGSHETALLPGRTIDSPPVWAPDGRRLAVGVDTAGKAQIVTLLVGAQNAPGAGSTLTADAPNSDNTNPAWSPDGRQIAFQSNRSGSFQIYRMPAAGGPVASYPGQPTVASAPAWSPDGKSLAFAGGPDAGHAELWTVPAAGGTPTKITNNGRAAARPVWTLDGKSLIFMLQTTNGTHNIVEIRPDGTGQRELTTGAQEDLFPVLSPDGLLIAFYSDRPRNNDVFVMARDGTAVTDVTNNDAGDISPSWAPDSSRLVFTSSRDTGSYRLYIVGRDGVHLTQLTQGTGQYDDTFPIWSAIP